MPVAREERRKEQQTEQENYVKAVLKTYDTNRSGHLLLFSTLLGVLGRAADVRARLSQGSGCGLSWEELRNFLNELHPQRQNDITEGEMKWVIQMATPDTQAFEGEWMSGTKQLEGGQLEIAAKAWVSYVADFEEVSSIFDKYDTQKNGFLNHQELASVLTELNKGVPVEDAQVDEVIEKASIVKKGHISKPAFVKAISVWYDMQEKELQRLLAPSAQSACCVIS